MKVDMRKVWRAVSISPHQFLQFIVALLLPYIGINQYLTQANKDWRATQARLLDITIHERVFSESEKINYLLLTYEYSSQGNHFHATSEEVQYSNSGIDSRIQELKREKSTPTIYYDGDEPSKFTFYKYETEPEVSILMTIPVGLIMAGVSYWFMKIRYEHYGP